MITRRKSRHNQEIQPQVITNGMLPASLAKRIFSQGVTDYFQFYFRMNCEFLLSVPDFLSAVGVEHITPIHAAPILIC
jgi:hypothetical protein